MASYSITQFSEYVSWDSIPAGASLEPYAFMCAHAHTQMPTLIHAHTHTHSHAHIQFLRHLILGGTANSSFYKNT